MYKTSKNNNNELKYARKYLRATRRSLFFATIVDFNQKKCQKKNLSEYQLYTKYIPTNKREFLRKLHFNTLVENCHNGLFPRDRKYLIRDP